MISAFEITAIILLAIGVALVAWWYIEAASYDSMLDGVPFAKGANLIYNPDGTDTENTVTMTCPEGKQVCVYQATQICTNPLTGNIEDPATDPISSDLDGTWGKFNTKTTIDLTQELNSGCGVMASGDFVAKGSCSYVVGSKIDEHTTNGSGTFKCENPDGQHFIATYTCEPIGSKCQSTS